MKYFLVNLSIAILFVSGWQLLVNTSAINQNTATSWRELGVVGGQPPVTDAVDDVFSFSISSQSLWMIHQAPELETNWWSGNDGITFDVNAKLIDAAGSCGSARNPTIVFWPALVQDGHVFLQKSVQQAGKTGAELTVSFIDRLASNDSYYHWKGNGRKGYGKQPRFGVNSQPGSAAIIVGLSAKSYACSRKYTMSITNIRPYNLGKNSVRTFVVLCMGIALLITLLGDIYSKKVEKRVSDAN